LVWCHRNQRFFPISPDLATDATFRSALGTGEWPQQAEGVCFVRNAPAASPGTQAAQAPEQAAALVAKLDSASAFNQGGVFLALQVVKGLLRSLPSFIRTPLVRLIEVA